MSLGETPGKSSWFSMLLFLVLREIFLFYEKYCERKFSVMKKLFLVSSLVLLVLFFGGCAKNGNSEPVSGISFIEEDTAAYTQGMKLVEFIPKQWEAMETAHAGKLFESAEVEEVSAEGSARYSLDYPELFDMMQHWYEAWEQDQEYSASLDDIDWKLNYTHYINPKKDK